MEDREKIKQELLEELKKEYQLVPLKAKQFTVADIFEKYDKEICKKIDIPDIYNNKMIIENALRKVVAMHFGVFNIKDLPVEKRTEYREELEKFIREYILKNE